MSDLVKRLREAANKSVMGMGDHWNLEDEAADAIERKDAAIAGLVDICKSVVERGIGASDIRAMEAAIAKYDK